MVRKILHVLVTNGYYILITIKISNQKLAASKRTKETNPKQGFYYEECSNVLSFLLFSLDQKFKT